MELQLSTSRSGERAVVHVAGEVDLGTAAALGEHALAAVRDVSPHVVLDASGISFMDSTGLKVLLTISRRAELAGGSFAVAAANRAVRKILGLTGLDQVLRLHETVDEAVAAPLPSS